MFSTLLFSKDQGEFDFSYHEIYLFSPQVMKEKLWKNMILLQVSNRWNGSTSNVSQTYEKSSTLMQVVKKKNALLRNLLICFCVAYVSLCTFLVITSISRCSIRADVTGAPICVRSQTSVYRQIPPVAGIWSHLEVNHRLKSTRTNRLERDHCTINIPGFN